MNVWVKTVLYAAGFWILITCFAIMFGAFDG